MLGTFRHLVVVTGCQRSGTTLLGQAIGAHPQAFMVDEPDGLYSWFHSLKSTGADTEEPWRRMVTAADTKYLKPHRRLVADGADDPPKFRDHITHLVLKAPNLVYEYDALASLGIKTNIIYPVRDPRSVVASMSKLTHIPMVRNQLALIGRHHSLATELADEMEMLADPDTPQHVKRAVVWRIKSGLQERFEARGLPVLSFRYEDFVTDPGALMSRIALHAGLAFDPAMLSHQSVYRGFGPGMTERARPIDRSSLTTWGDRLTPGEQRDVVRVTAAEMKSLGYDAEPGGQIASPAIARAGVPLEALRAPVIATGRGGSGTRLLTEATRASDVFLGNRLNASGDSVEWVDLIYEMTIQHETGSAPPCGWSALLRKKAAGILGQDRCGIRIHRHR